MASVGRKHFLMPTRFSKCRIPAVRKWQKVFIFKMYVVYKNPNYLKCKKPRFAIILLNKIKGYLYFNDEKNYK